MGNCKGRNKLLDYDRRNSQGQIVYSVAVTEPKAGETSIYRHPHRLDSLIEQPEEGMTTLQDLYLNSVKQYGKWNFLGVRPLNQKEYQFITYEESLTYCKEIGSGILNMQLETKDTDYSMQMVAIYAKNCLEWLGIELAGVLYKIQTVPLYDTLGKQGLEFILNETQVESVFCSLECLKLFLKHNLKGNVKRLICFEKLDSSEEQNLRTTLKAQNIEFLYYSEVQQKGKANILPIQKVSPNEIYTFSYTSGTTGNPKGALITHKNLLSVIAQGAVSESGLCFRGGGTHLSYLPFPHIFEKMYCWLIMYHGFTICFYSGNIKLFNEDISAARPTGMNGVPRIYTRLHDKINDQINKLGGVKKSLAKQAISTKLANLAKNGDLKHAIYDKLVFSKCQKVLGGRIKFMLTGSAPLQKEVQDFLKICTSSYMYEGYGGTENSACVAITSKQDKTSGHVGGPTMCNEIKLIDVEEMGYLTKDKMNPRGEICLRGPNIFVGYYRNQQLTDEVLDKDGWLHTGDIGEFIFDENVYGALRIIDRQKNIFKLAQGEYIASEKIELVYQKASSVQEIFVYGDSLKTYLVALIFPNFEYLQEQAKLLQISTEIDQMIKNQMIKKLVLDEITKEGIHDGLSSLEQVKKIELLPKCFTDYDVLTPAFKLKRFIAKVVFKDIIEELYKEQ